MQKKPTLQPSQLAKDPAVKEIAAQLAGKKSQSKGQNWTQTFAASGGKPGGKAP